MFGDDTILKGYPLSTSIIIEHHAPAVARSNVVFDALGNARVYKPAWEMDRIISLFKAEKGHQFDPDLVKVFLDNIDEFIKIKETYKDELPAAAS